MGNINKYVYELKSKMSGLVMNMKLGVEYVS